MHLDYIVSIIDQKESREECVNKEYAFHGFNRFHHKCRSIFVLTSRMTRMNCLVMWKPVGMLIWSWYIIQSYSRLFFNSCSLYTALVPLLECGWNAMHFNYN